MVVNHFRNKRAAHNINRSSADTWNPFRHVSWGNRERRRDTWAGRELEEAPGEDQGLAHATTAPTSSRVEPSISDTVTASPVKDSDETSRPRSADPAPHEKPLANGEARGLRQRKADDDASGENGVAVESPSSADDNGKDKKKTTGILRHVKPKHPFTVANQLQRTFLNSWINVLILAAPAGIAMKYAHVDGIAVFVVNFVAIIPLAAMLSFATEEVALRTGEALGGLINATFGNAVELIVAIIALIDKKIAIVQTSLIGSILSNLLLVMGFCFFFGGLRRQEQHFNHTVAQTAASLLALAAASVIVPSVFEVVAGKKLVSQEDIAKLSRGTAVILLIVYAAYLFFQLKTHQDVYNTTSQKVPAKPWSRKKSLGQGVAMPIGLVAHGIPDRDENQRLSRMLMNQRLLDEQDNHEEEDPQLHFFVALGTLAISTAIIAFCAEAMVDSIDDITKRGGLKEEFVGLILLPIVGNAAEHATAVTVAIKDKMDLAIGVAVGSSMQVALFLIPFLVIIGWGMGEINMDLSFDMFQVAVMFVAVLLTNYLIGDGKSHWLEGLLLICLYAIIGICAFWYPDGRLDEANGPAT
ncbi:Sodium/calcium exchanger membrane region [Moelleriella libera RCEF 2490]|uniref:Sodium/calcium exchanger membrane region n=1 Tax=Moelleriella libera RCEF 2490 TaxID=1081109 RepID=A0A166UEG9_9HYPO|nr:Sodium/calcium exchanger membrane region [Moelleriella libera RCEF 2490]